MGFKRTLLHTFVNLINEASLERDCYEERITLKGVISVSHLYRILYLWDNRGYVLILPIHVHTLNNHWILCCVSLFWRSWDSYFSQTTIVWIGQIETFTSILVTAYRTRSSDIIGLSYFLRGCRIDKSLLLCKGAHA